MRENRTYGLEGGEARAFPTPIKGDEGKPCTCKNTISSAAARSSPAASGSIVNIGAATSAGEERNLEMRLKDRIAGRRT